jgi:5-methylcytosine-specific restriction endonuclease McrA
MKPMPVALRQVIYLRSQGMCDRCGTRLPEQGWHAHHRQLRSRGGPDTPANLAVLCARCHDLVHRHPKEATARGWMVPSWADPETTPVLRHGRLWLQPGTGWTRAEPITEGANDEN